MATTLSIQEERMQDILERSFLGAYLRDEKFTDLSFNGTSFWVQHIERGRYSPEIQPTMDQVYQLCKQIADEQKREFNNANPVLDTEIGYIRLNAMHEAISPDGLTMAIRVSRPRLVAGSIAEFTTVNSEEVDALLRVLMLAEKSILISGRTGSGKTEFQKILIGFTKDDAKISLIEDTRDSHIKSIYPDKDINSWKTIPGKFGMADGVRAALRNNPDWTIIAETRDGVSADILDSAKSDHATISTLHVQGAMNIPSRLIPMIRQSTAYAMMDNQLIGNEIVEFLRFGIYLQRELVNGRYVGQIKEIVEFTDYTPRGAIGTYLYRDVKVRNKKTGEYHSTQELNPLSEKTLAFLEDKELIHLLPDVYLTDDYKVN